MQPEESRTQINQWFESVTAGRIKELLPGNSISRDTLAVLGNALWWKAEEAPRTCSSASTAAPAARATGATCRPSCSGPGTPPTAMAFFVPFYAGMAVGRGDALLELLVY